jgi:hypothetical protein
MPRLYFNVSNLPRDSDGVEIDGPMTARREALKMFGEIVREQAGDLTLPFEMEVSGEDGAVLIRLTLRDD